MARTANSILTRFFDLRNEPRIVTVLRDL